MKTNIIKPISDSFNYLYKELPNGLKALIISDPAADKSAASLSVNVGSLVDPKEYQGLAHFCEHMLFMGTEKYPDENEYNQFLTDNGGESNAYTSDDITNYYFEVSNEAFDKALDKFAQFFVKPLFKIDTVQRELKAVDSEHKKNLLNDEWRFYQLTLSEAKSDSVFNSFSTGNVETLDKPGVRDALLQLYNKYYTSEIMTLCILSNESIEKLEGLVSDLFSGVPKRENFVHPKYDQVPAYDSSNLKMFYKIFPINDTDELRFVWYLKSESPYYKEIPLSFLTYLFGHEGPNTLTSSLIKDNLISTLTTSKETCANAFSFFTIEIILTKKGLKEYKTVIYRVMKYIQMIQEQKLNERFSKELIETKQIAFDYRSKKAPYEYVEELSKSMQRFPPEDILCGGNVVIKYDPVIVKEYFDALKLENLNVYFLSKSLEKDCTIKEKWFGTLYTKQPLLEVINENEIKTHQCTHPLDYPPVNNFIPTNFDLIKDNSGESPQYPVQIYKDNECSVWYKRDTSFNLPKAHCEAMISLAKDVSEISYEYRNVITALWNDIITNEMAEIVYMANEAKTKFSFVPKVSNIYLSLAGFNSSILNAIKEILNRFNQIVYDDKSEKLKIYIQKEIQTFANFYKKTGYKVVMGYVSKMMSEPSMLKKDSLELLKTKHIDIDLIMKYVKEVFSYMKIEWIIQGNLSKEEAIEIGTIFAKNLKFKSEPLPKAKLLPMRPVKINYKTNYVYTFKNVSPEESDSTIISFYQCGHLNNREKCLLFIIENILKDRFFDDLRTKKGLGYIVCLLCKEYLGNEGILCLVQSSEKAPEDIWLIINEFFEIAKKEIFDVMTEEMLKTYVNSVVVEKKKAYINLAEEVVDNYREIMQHEFMFDRKQKICDILENGNITIKEVQEYFNKNFIDEVSRLDVEYVSHGHWEENEKKIKENIETSKVIKREKVESVMEFKMKNGLYPDFYNLGFN